MVEVMVEEAGLEEAVVLLVIVEAVVLVVVIQEEVAVVHMEEVVVVVHIALKELLINQLNIIKVMDM
jgi:hypothetical protein